ncbi:MAG: DNA mismatch repair protein MutS [Rhodospirillaceae bacterium]|nr:DNA mismatch repair protein MutS [Rhodospirillaceae bacterium]MBT4427714.1 DNA mismatch repair protein MutS [Rhodospirillaceae bacterium]
MAAMAGKRKISRDEENLWRQVTDGIEPLAPGAATPEAESKSDDVVVKKARATKNKDKVKPAKNTPPPATPPADKSHPELTPGKSAGLDKRNAQRLKRGQLRPEARVDLHGMIQSEAHVALNDFIAESHMAGLRNVLVITGKGSVREGGVLRRMVPRWLNQPPLRGMVVAIEQATPRDGGGGAYYLLLRRRR